MTREPRRGCPLDDLRAALTAPAVRGRAAHLTRLADLLVPLAELDVTDHEHAALDDLAREDARVARVVAALLARARAADPLP